METLCTFVDRIRDQGMKILLLMDGKRKFDETPNQALRTDTVKAAARSPARPCMV
jgi:hypothetical protein